MRKSIVGALGLKPSAYMGLRNDSRSWVTAMVVVGVVAVSHGYGAVLRAPSQPYSEPSLNSFLFGFQGEILLWLGMSAFIFGVARVLLEHAVSFGQVARPLGVAALPGVGIVVAGALSGRGHSALPILLLLAVWRLAASFVAVKHGLATTSRTASVYLIVGIVGGVGVMAVGTALLNSLS
jgi:hypothetical protein